MELGEVIDKKLEEKKLEADEKPDLHVAKLGNIKYISTEEGVELLRQLKDMFDTMDGWEKEKQEYQRDMVQRRKEKVKFSIPVDFIDHKEYITYETTERGLDHFKHLMDPHKEKRELVLLEELIEEIPNLTFYDGVILAREIVKRMIEGYFVDDEKDIYGCSYGAGLWDKMSDILDNNVLAQVQKHRAEDLHSLFKIRNSQYII